MCDADRLVTGQVGDRARQLEYPVVHASRQLHPLHGRTHEPGCLLVQVADADGATSFSYSTRGTSTNMSMRSSRGPLIRFPYLLTWPGVQVHSWCGSPKYPHGQGFIAPTSMKLAGKVTEPCARVITTLLSSRGCLSASSIRCPNSDSSSRNRTPLWLMVISPGPGTVPPPTRPA